MSEQSAFRELVLAVLAGAATWAGVRLAQKLEDPYSEPRLTVSAWANKARGGDA